MSPRFLRLVLAFGLALLIPLQGFAASAAGLCMAFGHHDGEAQAHNSHEGDDEHHQHDSEKQGGTSHCAPCAACCATAAIASFTAPVFPDERTELVNAAAPPAFAGVQPETLDRPPLRLL